MDQKLLTNAIVSVSPRVDLVLTTDNARQVLKDWVISNLGCAGYMEDCLNDGLPIPIPSFVGHKGIGDLTDAEIVKELTDLGIAEKMYSEAMEKYDYDTFQISIFVNHTKLD